jgi:hypothetical protein
VNSFDQLIGLQQQILAGFRPEDRAIVANAANYAATGVSPDTAHLAEPFD